MEVSTADKRCFLVELSPTEYRMLSELANEAGGSLEKTFRDLTWHNLVLDHTEMLHAKTYEQLNKRFGGD